MSLKAKLEAVIYAAEEPVTLAQLAALFAAEALEWKAAQEAVSANVESAPETVPLLNAEFDDPLTEQSSTPPAGEERRQEAVAEPAAAVPSPETYLEPSPEAASGAEPFADAPFQPASDESGPATAGEPPIDPEAEAKRLARQRDREVRAILRGLLDELIAAYASDDRGIEIKEIAGGFRMATKPECHDAARAFVKSLKPALKLSLPALETLAVIAYKQPVTAPEVNEIRGVDSSGVFGSLLARKLIATAGRKQVIGRPILYKTTKEFLLRFGLKDVTELPSMEEFEKMAQMEFEEMEPSTEESAEPEASETSGPEVDEDPDDRIDQLAGGQPEAPLDDQPGKASSEGNTHETAAMADSKQVPELENPDTPELAAEHAAQAELSAAEAAPAAPSLVAEQVETETVPHD